MKVSTKYTGVESITYEFTPYEVQEALMKAHGIARNGTIDFELGEEGTTDPEYLTTITVRIEKAKEGA